MQNMQVFRNSEFGELNVIGRDGSYLFPATACAKKLGYTNPRKAVLDHCKGGHELLLPSAGGNQKVKYIPEGDLYRLIVKSKLPSAEKFEKWVFDEVLPSIRKNGAYGMDIEKIISITVSEVMKRLAPEAAVDTVPKLQAKRKKNRVYSKVDFLPTEMKDNIIQRLFSDKNTYMEISAYLKKEGYNIFKSSVGRYASKLYQSIDEVNMTCGEE